MNVIHKKRSIYYLYLLSYIYFLFAQFICKDSSFNEDPTQLISSNPEIINYLYYSSIIFAIVINLIIYVCVNKYNKSVTFVFVFFSIILIFIISLIFKMSIITPFLFVIFLFIINLDLIDFKVFIRTDFITRCISIIIIIGLYYINLLPKYSGQYISHNGQYLRSTLGFSHPNELGIVFLSLFISGFILIYQLDKKFYISLTIIFLFIYLIISKLSDSREFEICGALILLSILLIRFKIWERLMKLLAIPSIIVSIILYLYVMIFRYNNYSSFINILNKYSSNRIYYQINALNLYPPKFSGYKNLSLLSSQYNNGQTIPVDDLYTTMLFNGGIIGLIIYELFFISLPILLLKTRNQSLYILIVISAICAFAGFSGDLMIIFLIIYSYHFNNDINDIKL